MLSQKVKKLLHLGESWSTGQTVAGEIGPFWACRIAVSFRGKRWGAIGAWRPVALFTTCPAGDAS